MFTMDIVTERSFGEQLRDLRCGRRLSLRDVQVLVDGDLTWQAVSRLEVGGRMPRSDSLVALARGLNVRFVIDGDGIRIEDQ